CAPRGAPCGWRTRSACRALAAYRTRHRAIASDERAASPAEERRPTARRQPAPMRATSVARALGNDGGGHLSRHVRRSPKGVRNRVDTQENADPLGWETD